MSGLNNRYRFEDMTQIDGNIKINGVSMPETSEPVSIEFNTVSDGGRLADNINYVGTLKGVKVTIILKYNQLNKEHYDLLFNNTIGRYLNACNSEGIATNGKAFFMQIQVPTYTPLSIKTYTGYFNATHINNCVDTTEKFKNINSRYGYGGDWYDELHENVEFKFVQQ